MNRIQHFTFAFLAGAALAACGLTAEEQFARAQESFAAHEYSKARLDLVSALKQKPGDPVMLELLARTKIAMGDGEGTLATLQEIDQASFAAKPELALLMAEAELLRARYDEALALLDNRSTPEANRLAALAYLGLEEDDKALAALGAGLALGGGKAALLATYARVELARGNTAQARKRLAEARKLEPKLLDALLLAAELEHADNDLPRTLAAYELASKIYPESFAALVGRAATLGDMGRLDDAAPLIDRASAIAPNQPQVLQLVARLALARGEWDRARTLLQNQEDTVRRNPSLQVSYATALLRLGQVEQAKGWLHPMVSRYPSMRSPRLLLAEAQLASSDGKGALATIRPVADRPDASPAELEVAAKAARLAGSADATGYAQRAKLPAPEWLGGELAKADSALRNRQWQQAATSYELILERSAKPNAMVLNNLAYAKSQMDQKDEALRLALKALALSPEHPAILDTAGWLLVETGSDKDRGVALLRRANQLDPDNPGIARRLATADNS